MEDRILLDCSTPGARHVQAFIQSTDAVEPDEAFSYWRATALPLTGSIAEVEARHAFAARRFVAVTDDSTILHTTSSPISVARTADAVRRDPRDKVALAVFLRGGGYVDQGGRNAQLGPGDVSLVDTTKPYRVGGDTAYEEVRIVIERDLFRAHIGEPRLLTGRRLGGGPLGGLFSTYLQTYAGSVASMTQAEASLGLEGALHLLRGLAGAPGSDLSGSGLRILADQCIARGLADPTFGVETLWRTLGVSRSRLYAAFADGPGVATTIRDARLDRAHQYLCAPQRVRESITEIQYACGFTDPPTFSTAFRRRFGLSPRALRDQLKDR